MRPRKPLSAEGTVKREEPLEPITGVRQIKGRATHEKNGYSISRERKIVKGRRSRKRNRGKFKDLSQ